MSMKKNGKLIKDAELLADTPNKASGESGTPAKKRKFTRKTLIKVMFVISIIFIMISLTYSWFTASNSASISGLDIDVVDPNNLVAGGLTSKGVINSVAGDGTSFFKPVFETLIGVDYVRQMILDGYSAPEIKARWSDDVERFKKQRKPDLLYAE